MKDVTELSRADKRYIEACFGIDIEYFLLEQAIRNDLIALDYLVAEQHRMRAARQSLPSAESPRGTDTDWTVGRDVQ